MEGLVLFTGPSKVIMINLNLPPNIKDLFEGCRTNYDIQDKCFDLLSEQPNFHIIRIILSKLFFAKGHVAFAIRELLELKKHGDFPLVDRILRELGVGILDTSDKKIIADVSF